MKIKAQETIETHWRARGLSQVLKLVLRAVLYLRSIYEKMK